MMKLAKALAALLVLGAAGLVANSTFFRTSQAPDVVFTSIKGEKVAAADLRGRVVLVNFWATDCAVCVKEMPQLVKTYTRYRDKGLELMAVAMPYDPPNYVLDYAERNALPFSVVLDPMGQLARAFGDVKLTPTTIVIDKRGNVVSRILGEPDFPKLERLIEEKLAEPA